MPTFRIYIVEHTHTHTHTCGNMVLSAADLIGGAENLGDNGDVGWEELVSEAPPTTLSLGDSVQTKEVT